MIWFFDELGVETARRFWLVSSLLKRLWQAELSLREQGVGRLSVPLKGKHALANLAMGAECRAVLGRDIIMHSVLPRDIQQLHWFVLKTLSCSLFCPFGVMGVGAGYVHMSETL